MPNDEMSQFLGVFLDEASEQLDALESAVLNLEGGSNPELVQELFRSAHTLKGSSQAMGLVSMGDVTHAMEDLLEKLRQGELNVTPMLVDTLFRSLDLLKRLKQEIAATGEPSTDTGEVISRLRTLLETAVFAPALPAQRVANDSAPFQHRPLPEAAAIAAQAARSAGWEVYRMTIRIAPDCAMKSVRALMFLQSLETLGSILDTTPGEDELENEDFGHDFRTVYATEHHPEDIRSLCFSVPEIVTVDFELLARIDSASGSPSCEPCSTADQRVADLGPEARGKNSGELHGTGPATSQTVRVDVSRLDTIQDLVGALAIDRARMAQQSASLRDLFSGEALVEQLQEAVENAGRTTLKLQQEVLKTRIAPIGHVFDRMPRVIRDLSLKLGKNVDFVVSGGETEVDRPILEAISDPITHLLRNSMDHGIEQTCDRTTAGKPERASVWLRAWHQDNHVVIEVEDDGRGMDPGRLRRRAVESGLMTAEAADRLTDREAVSLMFAPGFSTAETVTGVSGRGVGMDIVKSNLARIGAQLDVHTKVGIGTTFAIRLPDTVAILRSQLVGVASTIWAIPLDSVRETIRIRASQIHIVDRREAIVLRGRAIPLVRLHRLLRGGVAEMVTRYNYARKSNSITLDSAQDVEENKREQTYYVVVVGVGDRHVGLVVESLLGEQETVIKSLGKFVGDVRGISGATILGDGSIALIVDVYGLLAIITEAAEAAEATKTTEATEEKVGAYAA
jgi:two-component system chemotaxis sensor kinase CheA